jgi:hypothetical protein
MGKDVRKWNKGDRITVPFSMGCAGMGSFPGLGVTIAVLD